MSFCLATLWTGDVLAREEQRNEVIGRRLSTDLPEMIVKE